MTIQNMNNSAKSTDPIPENVKTDIEKIAADPAVLTAIGGGENVVASALPAKVRKWLYPIDGALISAGGIIAADPSITGIPHLIALAVVFAATGFHTALATSNTRD